MSAAEIALHLLANVGLAGLYLLLLTILSLHRRQKVAALPAADRLRAAVLTILAASLPGLFLGIPAAGLVTNLVHDALFIAVVAAVVNGFRLLAREAGPKDPRIAALQVEIEEAEAQVRQLEAAMETQISAQTSALAAVTVALEKDITSRKLAGHRASEGRRWTDELMLRTNTAVVLLDREARVLEGNDALARLLGRATLGEMLNCDFGRALGRDDRGRLRHFCDETLRLGMFTCQLDAMAPGRGAVSIEADGVASVQNGLPCIMALLHDVSARSAAEKELIRSCDALSAALEDARAASASRPAFLARVDHELRTSLTGIIGLNEMLRHTASAGTLPGSDIRKLCDGIHQSGSHLLSLVNDLLDLSRLEAGTWSLHPARMAIRTEIETALATLDPIAERRRITFENTCSPDLDVVLDRQAFRQIVIKLASNAVRFSPSGGMIRIDVARRYEGLALRITDQGPGVEESGRERMLKPFHNGCCAEDLQLDGVGLSLAIVAQLIKLQNGSLRIDNQGAGGTTVTAILPSADRLMLMQLAAE